MSDFRCVPMSTVDAERFRLAIVDDFGYPIRKFDEDATYPCRHSLKEVSARDGMLLLSYRPPLPKSIYGHPMAIFLAAYRNERFDSVNVVPEIVRNRLVSFRAFDQAGMAIYEAIEIVEPNADHEAAIRRIFARHDVAYINAHTARAGCILTHIERA